jgi:NAD(P)-dependent dehydrogenase (short-subunit alcohol dehydrogenase family)
VKSAKPRRVILITGASSGIGLLCAVELAKRGHRVYASMRNVAKREQLVRMSGEAKVEVECIELDVDKAASVNGAVAAVLKNEGRIDVLVNNAAIGLHGFFEDVSEEEFDVVMTTNFRGALKMIRAVLPGMRERGAGLIVNVSSLHGFVGLPLGSSYSASKWALEGLSESLRFEMRPFGVRVTLIQPGYVSTKLVTDLNHAARSTHAGSPYHAASIFLAQWFGEHLSKYAGDPRVVAKRIADIVVKSNPRLRYRVGKDSFLVSFLRAVLPWRIFEAMFVGLVSRALEKSR